MADVVSVVDTGLTIVAAQVLALGASAPAFIEWGVGVTPPVRTNTDIQDSTGCAEARTDATGTDSVVASGDGGTDTYRVVGTITKADEAAAITEVCTFTSLAAGDLFLRATFSAINLEIGNSIEFTIDTKFAPA